MESELQLLGAEALPHYTTRRFPCIPYPFGVPAQTLLRGFAVNVGTLSLPSFAARESLQQVCPPVICVEQYIHPGVCKGHVTTQQNKKAASLKS